MRYGIAVAAALALLLGVAGLVQAGWADQKAERAETDLRYANAEAAELEREVVALRGDLTVLTADYVDVVEVLGQMLKNDEALVRLLRQRRTTVAATVRP